jgi:hypothetical protein
VRPLPGSGGAARATEGVWREINKSVGNDVVTGDDGPLEALKWPIAITCRSPKKEDPDTGPPHPGQKGYCPDYRHPATDY